MRKDHDLSGWAEREVRSNFSRASRAGRRAASIEPRAADVEYRARDKALRIELTNGAAVTLPVKLIPDLRTAAARDVRAVEILGRGGGLHWESLDLDLSVPGLLSSVFAGPEWLAELGRIGGRNASAAKAAAARRNGRKGGRPRIRSRNDSARRRFADEAARSEQEALSSGNAFELAPTFDYLSAQAPGVKTRRPKARAWRRSK